MVQGPSATVAAVSAAVVAPLAGAGALGSAEFAEWSALLALISGGIYLVLGVLRMGWVSNFLSKAVLAGFIIGFAVGIVIEQLPNILGIAPSDGSYVEELVGTLGELGSVDLTTLAVGAVSLAILLVLRYSRPRWPRALIAVVVATAAASLFDLSAHGVAITGEVPTGLSDLGIPDIGGADIGKLALGALSVVFVGYSETLAAARAVATRHGYEIRPDQELIAQGTACAAAGFTGGFVSDGSLSKTSVADTAGQRTQLSSLINAGLVLLTLLLLASLFEELPAAALGAVVIDAMVGLLEVRTGRRYFRVNRADWFFFVAAMIGILCFGIIAGVVIGVVLSLLLLIGRASTPAVRVLGRRRGSDAYLDVERHEDLVDEPGVLVLRIDGPLFFANANRFRDAVRDRIERAPTPVRAVVLDAEAISQTDTDGADILSALAHELRGRKIAFVLARVESSVSDLWGRAGALDAIGRPTVHTVREAVDAVS